MKHTLVLPLVRIYDNVTSVVGEYKKRWILTFTLRELSTVGEQC